MKKFKGILKLVCILMAIAMLFSACGGGKATGAKESTGDKQDAVDSSTTAENTAPAETEKIVFASLSWGEEIRDLQAVEDKLKEITRAKINVEADINMINASTYQQQLNVMMAGGEELDLLFVPFGQDSAMVGQNQLMPLDDLLEQYGQDILNSLGTLINAGKFNGKTYTVSFNGSKLYPEALAAREDILQKYNLNLDDCKSYKDLAKIFEVVKKNEPEMVCIAPNYNGLLLPGFAMGDGIGKIDELGDVIGVLIGNDNYNIVNLFETEQYKDIVYTMRDWYNKGYILKDAATTSESGSVMYNQGKVFSYFYVDILDQLDKAYHHVGITRLGQPTMVKAFNKPIINSSTGFYTSAISSQSKKPEAAMKWWNLMYKDEEAVNTLYWGVEGKNFVKNDDGTISYASEEEAANKGWDTPFNWMFGNTALQYIFQSPGYSADFMAQRVKQNEGAEMSIAFGFTFDITPVQTEYTAVTNVLEQYRRALESGSVDPEIELPKFIQKLKEADIDKIIAEKQRQLDKWVAENKK